MKQLIVLFATVYSLTALGQGRMNNNMEFKKVLIGLIFSTDYNFRTLKNNDGSPSSDFVIKSRNNVEIAKFGYTTGVNICIKITKLFELETGVQYSNKGYKTKNQDLVYGQPDPSLPTKAKFIYNFHYIDIPVKVNFSLGKKRIQFIPGVGISTNILINETVKSINEYSNGKTEQKTESAGYNFKHINISPMISFGISYKVNNKMILKAEPTYRFGVIKIIDTPVTEYLWNAGLNIGFFYRLKSKY